MPARKLQRGRREYGIEDESGNILSDPSTTTKAATRIKAASLAEMRGESVYVFEVGKDSDGRAHIIVDREEIKPTPRSRAQIKREVDAILKAKPAEGTGGLAKARETSERRIAALIANGEDVRNTPAWRDAVAESHMVDLMSRADADTVVPFGRRSGIDRSKHTRVNMHWYAIPNQNKAAGGFLPMIEEDGKARGDTWAGRGYSRAEAEALAEEKAHEAASRFVGDWNVVVTKGRPTGAAHAQKKASWLKDIAPGLRDVTQRSVNAENRFLTFAMEHGRLTRAQAATALTAFRKARVIKFDAVNGTFHVKHGQFLEPEVLRRAAGIEE